MSLPVKVMRDGLVEKRSSGLLQLWKKKRCVLTDEGLRLHKCKGSGGGGSGGPGGSVGDSDAAAAQSRGGSFSSSCSSKPYCSKAKELRFERMATVDCVEYKRGLVYFTVVMATGKEIDFRCPQDGGTAWNAEIALALVRYKNLQAVQTGRNRHLSSSQLGSSGEDEAQ